ncbi:MAG: hypothetical protein Q9220_002911 [cf. Caloplaca sp. 1 TL-2023]
MWSNRRTASLYFRQYGGPLAMPSPPSMAIAGNSDLDTGFSSVFNQISNPGAVNETDTVTIAAALQPGARTLNYRDAWIAMFGAIQALAYPSAGARAPVDVVVIPERTDVKLLVSGQNGPGLPHTVPPFFYYSTAIRAIRLVATWLISEPGRFRDMAFAIFSNSFLVGAGFLEHVTMPGTALEHLPSNESISTS